MLKTLEDLAQALRLCNRCGFCQAGCPTYLATGIEWMTARGRIMLLRDFLQGKLKPDKELKDPLFSCLTCNGCLDHCPPGVDTAQIILRAREEFLHRNGQPWLQRLILRGLLPHRRALGASVSLLRLGQSWGLSTLALKSGLLGSLGKVGTLLPRLPHKAPLSALGVENPQRKVAYFPGCATSFAFPQVAGACLRVLHRHRVQVLLPDFLCCAKPASFYGDMGAVRKIAEKNLHLLSLEDIDAIVTTCATCSSFLKGYASLFHSDPHLAERAQLFSSKVKDFSAFLMEMGPNPPLRPLPRKVTYHDPCHLGRFQKVTQEPRHLLRSIPGVEFVEMEEANLCCGAAGTFPLTHYDLSLRILERKMRHVAQTGAQVLVTSCPACLLQLSHGVRRAGLPIETFELATFLGLAYQPEEREGGKV